MGRFKPLDVVDLAVDHRAHAEFICDKLWGFFSPRPLPAGLRRQLARTYRRADTDVRPVLRAILTNKLFYASLADPDMVKPPFVYVAGMLRADPWAGRRRGWTGRLDQMGQVPFHPPNVSGWQRGTAWLSTSSIRRALRRRHGRPLRDRQGRLGLGPGDPRPGDRQGRGGHRRAARRPAHATRCAATPRSRWRGAPTRGRSSTTSPSASACCATCCWPAPTPRSAEDRAHAAPPPARGCARLALQPARPARPRDRGASRSRRAPRRAGRVRARRAA